MKPKKEANRKDKHETTKVIVSAILIAALFILSSYLFRNVQPDIERIVGLGSIIGMSLYVVVFAISIIIVPISAMPLIPIGTKLWSVEIAAVLATVGWTLGAMVAFAIARRFGRSHVAKIISLDEIDKIQKLIPEKNIFWTIFFFRTVTPFDGLSYALGLVTRVKTKTFFWATLTGLFVFSLIMSYLGSLPTVYLVAGLVLAGLFCIIGIVHSKREYAKRHSTKA